MPESRIWVDAWSPEYGASSEWDNALPASEEEVDPYVEASVWGPILPAPVPVRETAFIDGVDRVDARAFLEVDRRVAPGLFGSVGAGAVITNGRARFDECRVQRWTVFGDRADARSFPLSGALSYGGRSVAGSRPEELRAELQKTRSNLEQELARELAMRGLLVIADGPITLREPLDLVGYIKSHQKTYLWDEHLTIATSLKAGERTPIFQFGRIRPRFSWYTRIAEAGGQHPWAAIARCEVSVTVGLNRAIGLANEVSYRLPRFASKPFWDTRAPQNLVPIASLERKLWSLLGERELVLRRIRSGVSRYA